MAHVLLLAGALMPEQDSEHFAAESVPEPLARRLMRATRSQERFDALWSYGAAHLPWLARAFRAPGDPPATAPFAWNAESGHGPAGPTSAAVWFCEPVHLSLEPERTVLTAVDSPPLTDEEACELFAEAADSALSHGVELRRGASHWYLLTDPAWLLWTTALQATLGASVEHRMPRGEHASQWRRLLNEVQMRWHASRTNREREARGQPGANALWLHGGGTWCALQASRFAAVDTDDPVVLGWQQAAGQGGGTPAGTDSLTIWPHLFEAYWRGDWSAWGSAWKQLGPKVESLLQSVRTSRDRRLELVACGHRTAARFMLDGGAGLLAWRRRSLRECLLESAP
jgi:hypothetical protein